MTVTEVKQKSASASFSASGRQYNVTYQVKTDSRSDGPLTVAQSPLLPGPTATYQFGDESDAGAGRTGVPKVSPVSGSEMLYMVDVTFQTAAAASGGGSRLAQVDQSSINLPWDLPAEISGNFISSQVERWSDAEGSLVLNSAHRYIDPPLMFDETHPTVAIRKAYAPGAFSLAFLNDMVNRLNSKPFFGMGIGFWRLTRAPWQLLYMAGYAHYYSVTYEFEADPENQWQKKPPDAGYEDINGAWPTDERGIPMPGTLGQLDGAGVMLGSFGDVATDPVLCDGLNNRPGPYKGYESRDFALLGIPTALP